MITLKQSFVPYETGVKTKSRNPRQHAKFRCSPLFNIKIDDVHNVAAQRHPIPNSLLVYTFSYKQRVSCDIQRDTQLALPWQRDRD